MSGFIGQLIKLPMGLFVSSMDLFMGVVKEFQGAIAQTADNLTSERGLGAGGGISRP